MPLTQDQENFQEMVGRFLAGRSPTTEVRRLMETPTGYDPAVWQQLCGELGLAGRGWRYRAAVSTRGGRLT